MIWVMVLCKFLRFCLSVVLVFVFLRFVLECEMIFFLVLLMMFLRILWLSFRFDKVVSFVVLKLYLFIIVFICRVRFVDWVVKLMILVIGVGRRVFLGFEVEILWIWVLMFLLGIMVSWVGFVFFGFMFILILFMFL